MTDQLLERFWDKVEVQPNDCWIWTAYKDRYGYGSFKLKGKPIGAHRLAYQINKGEIPIDREIDHLCRNRACVNPDHLETVTHKINLLRGSTISAINIKKTYCPKGHEYNQKNTHVWRGHRFCRICDNMRHWRKLGL